MHTRKPLLRLLALLLSLLMLLSVTACGASEEENTTDAATGTDAVNESDTAFDPGIERKNYDCEFVISKTGVLETQYWFAEQRENDTMSDAVYERQERIRDRIGVTIKTLDAGNWIAYGPTVTRLVQTGDDVYQLVPTNTYQGITQLITTNSLYDLNDLPSLNFDAPYWRSEVMDDLTVDGKRLLGYNDFLLSFVHLLVFNKDLMEQYVRETPYGLVRNKQWTLDKFFSMASQVVVDDGDGKWTTNDKYGLIGWGWQSLIDMVTACDIKIVDKDADGHYYVAYEDQADRLVDVMEKIYGMYTAEYSWLWKSVYNSDDVIPMESGRALFELTESTAPIWLKQYDLRYGVLPFPMYDENQTNYRQLSWNAQLCVPSVIKNTDMVSDTIELLAAYAEPVKEAYYVNLLGSKSSDTQDDADMLDIIWAAQVSDVGLVYCNCASAMDSLVYMCPMMCEAGNINLTSYLKKHKKNAQKGLDKVFEGKKR